MVLSLKVEMDTQSTQAAQTPTLADIEAKIDQLGEKLDLNMKSFIEAATKQDEAMLKFF